MATEQNKRTGMAFAIGLAAGIILHKVVMGLLWPMVAG
jgi:hypothetical protein